ncbi:MAG: hypothetical protein WC998_07375 [Candidatus Paceibacterota bacterium]|jgi:hypothetical protein
MTLYTGDRYDVEIKGRTVIITDKAQGVSFKRKIASSKMMGNFAPIYIRLKGKLVNVERLLYMKEKVY